MARLCDSGVRDEECLVTAGPAPGSLSLYRVQDGRGTRREGGRDLRLLLLSSAFPQPQHERSCRIRMEKD